MKRIVFTVILYMVISLCCAPVIAPRRIKPTNPTIAPSLAMSPSVTHKPTKAPTSTHTPTLLPTSTHTSTSTPQPAFSFALTSDMTYHTGRGEFDTPQYFRGVCESIASLGNTHFMVSVGDISLARDTYWTVQQYLGENYLWYPLVGNHDHYPWDMDFLRTYDYDPNGDAPPNIVNAGPADCEETTLSFDYLNSHFVLLNVYCDTASDIRTDGAIVDALYHWLEEDLRATHKEHIFVFGHEPAFPQPDVDTGLLRHVGESLDKYPLTRNRFWKLLGDYNVTAYITAHTHAFSVVRIDDVWQVDTGHAMGVRTQATPSTYVIINVDGSLVTYDAYRASQEGRYILRHSGILD